MHNDSQLNKAVYSDRWCEIAKESASPETQLNCLGVVMPAFNEETTVLETLDRVLAQSCVKEVIVIDDGSTDGTAASVSVYVANNTRVSLIRHSINRGKGAAIRTGLAHLTAPIVIIQDADLELNPGDYGRLLEPILSGEADVVYGSRFMRGAKSCAPWWHKLGNRLLTLTANVLTGLRLTDEATCYKVLRREVFEGIVFEEDRFGFCPEFTAKISKLGLKIREVPVSYHARSRSAGKKLRLRDGLVALECLIKYSFIKSKPRPKW